MRYRIRGFTLDDRSFLLGTWISLSVAKEVAALVCSEGGFHHVQITDEQGYTLYDYQVHDDGIDHASDFIHTQYIHDGEIEKGCD